MGGKLVKEIDMRDTLGQRFMDFIRKVAGRILLSDDMKERFIAKLNEKIDIPVLNEKEEAEFIGLVWETVKETVEEVLEIDS